MSTTALIDDVAERTGLRKTQARQAVTAVLDIMTEQLCKGERIQLSGFGSFEIREWAERQGTNPKTREKMMIPASKAVGFRAALTIRQRLAPPGERAVGGT